MSRLVPVEGFEGSLARDPSSNAVVNVDQSGFEAFVARRTAEKETEKRLQAMQEKIDGLEELLRSLLINKSKLGVEE